MKKVLLTICCLILIGGCSWCEDKRIVIKSKPIPIKTDSYNFCRGLAINIKDRYETEMSVEEIARWMMAEISLQAYLTNTGKPILTDDN